MESILIWQTGKPKARKLNNLMIHQLNGEFVIELEFEACLPTPILHSIHYPAYFNLKARLHQTEI